LVNEKTLRTIIAMNDLYDTRLCGLNTVLCYMDHSSQCWSEVFFLFTQVFVIIVILFSQLYFTR